MSNIPHLVVVDDDFTTRILHTKALESLELGQVMGLDSVMALLDYLKQSLRQENPVDLILMDIMMPVHDGIEGCRMVREQEAFRDIPIMILTALRDDKYLEAAFEAGATDYLSKPINFTELKVRSRSLLRLKQEMDRRREKERELLELSKSLMQQQAQFERATYVDSLTGIYNRRAFDKKLEDEWSYCSTQSKPLALILLDIDFFKRYNDCYGHQQGDVCLRAVASCLPQPDTTIFAARYGGEEFALILPNFELKQAYDLAQSIRKSVEGLRLAHVESDVSPWVTISLGVASGLPEKITNSAELLLHADQALYQAKSAGRNAVRS